MMESKAQMKKACRKTFRSIAATIRGSSVAEDKVYESVLEAQVLANFCVSSLKITGRKSIEVLVLEALKVLRLTKQDL